MYEHRYDYYKVRLPPRLDGFQVVLVPETGDPNLYIAFDIPFPTGHNYTYVQDNPALVEVFYMTAETFGYCQGGGSASAGCNMYLSITAIETSSYSLVVLDTGSPNGTACADGCAWKQLGDGMCQPQCNNSACFHDRDDCLLAAGAEPQCNRACKPEYLGDGYCDPACFNLLCSWDGNDCGDSGCADGCLNALIGNGECDAACNVATCDWDGSECFHSHHECYTRADGADYRGTVSHTKSGKTCQHWSSQEPHAHTRTHAKYPLAGLGGHNFCRNPDGEDGPWCYTTEEIERGGARFELCDVGPPSRSCPPPPPPPPPRDAPKPPPPPPPHPKPPPPDPCPPPPRPPPPSLPPPPPPAPPCPVECVAMFEQGTCATDGCNRTACLTHEVSAS